MMKYLDIDWVKHETTTGVSKSITVNPAYPLGGSGNYQCSDTVYVIPVVPCEEYMRQGTFNCPRLRLLHPHQVND